MPYSYKYPRPSVTVDCVILSGNGRDSKILLVLRGHEPFQGRWAFPGGYMEVAETLEAAAKRELKEETGVAVKHLEQIRVFDDPHRDPRGRTLSIAFLGFVDDKTTQVVSGDDATEARWFPLHELPSLAFDHEKILKYVLDNMIMG
ncbi:MAG: NUDIX hydrolase [Bacteroidota bacterium]|nr:NUDIX hydrolase [Bacteroidota bacterium]MDP4273227.1 NUDIX hydrolase [Bacteroidota bacterium]